MAKIVINAGHTKIGKGTGAVGVLNESVETRNIAYELMRLLSNTKHEVIPAVIDKSNDNLKEVVKIANTAKCDLFISIHLNAGGGQGCEVYTWKGEKTKIATRICDEIHKLGFRNRGVKDGSHLYVIKKTKSPSILVECCFIDNPSDKKIYNYQKVAKAIYNAII